jgi:predicted AAA+ superfamily ATPase
VEWESAEAASADAPPLLGEDGFEALSRREFWEEVRENGARQQPLRDIAFAAFSERGGYPLVHQPGDTPWPDLASQLNENVIRRVIQHDLRVGDYGRKRDEGLLQEVFRLACRYAGQAPAVETWARETQRALGADVGAHRVRNYLELLDRTLLLRLIKPLELRLKKTQGSPKLCLADHGLRASWLQEVVPLDRQGLQKNPHLADLAGRIAESVLGGYLSSFGGLRLSHFPERPGEPEVDFVITQGVQRIPIEVKYRTRVDARMDTEGLRTFIEKSVYNAGFGVLVTQEPLELHDPRIVVVPLSSLLMMRSAEQVTAIDCCALPEAAVTGATGQGGAFTVKAKAIASG